MLSLTGNIFCFRFNFFISQSFIHMFKQISFFKLVTLYMFNYSDVDVFPHFIVFVIINLSI